MDLGIYGILHIPRRSNGHVTNIIHRPDEARYILSPCKWLVSRCIYMNTMNKDLLVNRHGKVVLAGKSQDHRQGNVA